MSYVKTANQTGTQRFGSNFRHLPPTAVEIEWDDIRSGISALINPGSSLGEFRQSIQEETGSTDCELVSSGRSALALILTGLKQLSNRTKVILPAYSCSTVVQSILAAELTPVFCDLSREDLDLDREHLQQLIDDEVLAVIPTHLYGLAQDILDLVELGRDHGFFVIEDAAQSFGARFGDNWVGSIGDVGFFSLGRGKCIPSGHGGVILANEHCGAAISNAVHNHVKFKANRDPGSLLGFIAYAVATRPFSWWFIDRSPFNPADQGMDLAGLPAIDHHSMSAVQAGIGNSIFARSQSINSMWRENANQIINVLCEFDFIHFPKISPEAEPVFLRLPFIVSNKINGAFLFKALKQQGIGISKSYFRTLPDLYADQLAVNPRDYPGANHIAECLYTLPTHSYLNERDIKNIVKTFQSLSEKQG